MRKNIYGQIQIVPKEKYANYLRTMKKLKALIEDVNDKIRNKLDIINQYDDCLRRFPTTSENIAIKKDILEKRNVTVRALKTETSLQKMLVEKYNTLRTTVVCEM